MVAEALDSNAKAIRGIRSTQPCPPPVEAPVAEDGTGDPPELALADIALAGQYHECAKLHQGLIEAAKASWRN